jgi:hypothetical protein
MTLRQVAMRFVPPKILIPLSTAILVAAATACGMGGGGGGGGSSSDTANSNYEGWIDFQLEKDSLDSGDLTQVSLTVYDMNPNGVILKFHYPEALRLVRGSGVLYVGNDGYSQQIFADAEESVDGSRYLAYFLFPKDMEDGNQQTVQFDLKAIAPDASAYLEVDLDNNDPNIPDRKEFSAEDPQFTNIDRFNVSIVGTPLATPTPEADGTPSASETPSSSQTPGTTPTAAASSTAAP